MPDSIDILIQSRFSGQGVTQAQQAYGRLEAAQRQLAKAQTSNAASGGLLTASVDKATAAVSKAEKAVLSEASAIARLQQTQGNAAGGAQTLAAALAQVDQSSQAAVRAQTQLATIENRIAAEAQRAAAAEREAATAAAQMATAASTSRLETAATQMNTLVGGAQKVALAFGAIGAAAAALKGVTDLAALGAQAASARDSFTNLATSAGQSSSKLLTSMHAAAAGTVSDTQLMISANTGLLLAGDKIATALPRLLEIARASAKATGQDVGFLFDSLVRGISRGSPKIIDNAGITLDAAAAMDTYARSIGKTTDQLTASEQQQATLNAVLTTGATFIDKIGLSADTDAVRMQQASAAVDDFKAALGERLLPVVGTVATGLKNMLQGDMFAGARGGAAQAQATIAAEATSYQDYTQRIVAANQQLHDELAKSDPVFAALAGGLQQLTPAQLAYAQSLIATGTAQGDAVAQAQSLQGVADNLQRTFFNVGAGAQLSAEQQATLGAQMLQIAASGDQGAAAVDDLTFAFQNNGGNVAQLQAGLNALTTEQQNHAAAAADDASMMAQYTPAVQASATAVADATTQSLLDSAAKDEQTAKTQLLTAETSAAADAFMALHPNISAAGVASLAAAGQIDPLLAQLIQARLRAEEARAALAAFNAQAGIRAQAAQDFRAGERSGGAVNSEAEQKRVTDQRIQTLRVDQQIAQLHETDGQRLKRLRGEYAAMAPYDERRVATEREIMSLEKGRARAGGGSRTSAGGGRAKVPRETEAEKTSDKLASIERSTGAKLAEIDANTQQKLIDIDKKAAEQRAAAQRALAAEIMTSTDDLIASQEADDLDLIGAKDDQLAKLHAREQAEATARIANEKAVAEAKATAADGDAQKAQDVLKIRQDAIQKQEALDEKYAEKQAELAGDPKALAALKQQYDEASAAIAQSENDRVSLAQQAADQRVQAVADEKAKVIADAEDQKQKVIGAAQEQLANVKGASAEQRAAVVNDLQQQAQAASAWAQQTEVYAGRVVSAYQEAARAAANIPAPGGGRAPTGGGGGGGATRAAGGLTGVTHGPTTLTVGDNPGGMEFVSVIPLSGRGTTTIGGGMARMAGGGSLLTGMGGGGDNATGMDSIIWQILNGTKNQKAAISALKQYLAIVEQAATIINTIAQIRATLATPQPILRVEDMERIARDAAMVTTILADNIVPATRLQANQLKGYTEMIKISVDSLKDITDLRKNAADAKSPLSEAVIRQLAAEVQLVTRILMDTLVPTGRQAHDALEYYADVSGKGVAILKDMADLRASLAEVKGPLDERMLRALAAEAQRVARIVLATLIPTGEQLAKEMGDYADSVGHSMSILKDVTDLRSALGTASSPIREADVRRIAAEAVRITRIMRGMLLPTTKEQGTAAGDYADAVGKSIAVLKDTLDLPGRLFADYTSPSDAQIRRVVADANRVTKTVAAAAKTYDTKGLEAAKQFSDAVGGTFSAFKDGLLFFEALNSGDFTLDPKKLDQFERATMRTLAVTKRLGAQAAKIPAGDIAALGATTAALSGQAEALIKLAAVPWGDLPAALAGLQRQGGALLGGALRGGPLVQVTINHPPSDLNVPALVRQIIPPVTDAVKKALSPQGRR